MILWVFAAFVSFGGIAYAVEPFCREAIDDLKPKTFLAKEPLYDTKIAADGILDRERDKEEIRQGARLKVVDIECEKNKLELTLKPVAGGAKVEIVFFLSIFERREKGGRELFEKMLGYVFAKDEVSADEGDSQ
jgi:hypothetical protein